MGPREASRRNDCFKSFIVLPHIAELSVMRYNVRLGRSDVKGRPQDVVVVGRENTKSSVTIHVSMSCVIHPVEPVWSYFLRLSARSPQVIHRGLHMAFRCDSSDSPPIFRMFCTPFSSTIDVCIPWTFSAAFSQRFRRKNGRKAGGDSDSAESEEKHFRKAGSAGIRRPAGETCTEIVARGTF